MISKEIVKEWQSSLVSEHIISLNVQELQGEEPWEFLLYNLDNSQRKNTGVLRDYWLKRYSHLDDGGWWCAGIDLITGNSSPWGCFKPFKPRLMDGKPIKYEHPPQTETGVFALRVTYEIGLKVAQRYGLETEYDKRIKDHCINDEDKEFWEWVKFYPKVDITITEGAKKAGCLLTLGFAAIGLPGVNNGVKDNSLIPEIGILAKSSRLFNICFDEDPKWKARINVNASIKRMGDLLNEIGCLTFINSWDYKLGKGIDDLYAKQGQEKVLEVLEQPLEFEQWIEEKVKIKILKDRHQVLDFIEGTFGNGRLRFNELTQDIELDNGEIIINDDFIDYLIKEYRVEVKTDKHLWGTLQSVARANPFHPVVEYLEKSFKKGDFADIDSLATRYLGNNSELANYCVKKWLIACVARVFCDFDDEAKKEGIKADYALVLKQSAEGRGKSTFFRILGAGFFGDNFGSELQNRKSLIALHQSWIQEWGEIERISKGKELSIVKTFMAQMDDTYVPPYGKRAEKHLRRFMFCGTTNEDEFLKSPTGDRRFLVVEVPDNLWIDREALKIERDSIWAAAVREYLLGKQKGERAWEIPPEKISQITGNNIESRVIHPWQERIEQAIEEHDLTRINITWVFDAVLNIPIERQDQRKGRIIAEILRGLGWRKHRGSVVFPVTGKKCQCWELPVIIKESLQSENSPNQEEIEHPPAPEHPEQGGVPVGVPVETLAPSDPEHPEHPEHQKTQKVFSLPSIETLRPGLPVKVEFFDFGERAFLWKETTILKVEGNQIIFKNGMIKAFHENFWDEVQILEMKWYEKIKNLSQDS